MVGGVSNYKLTGRVLKSVKILGVPEQIRNVTNTLSVHGIEIDKIVVASPFVGLANSARDALLDFEKQSGIGLELFEEKLGFEDAKSDVEHNKNTIINRSSYAQEELGGSQTYCFVKRGVDIIGSLVLIAILAPLFVFVWILTVLNIGSPAIFWQVRPGHRGRMFRVLKFRTMRGAHDTDGRRIPDSERSSAIGVAMRQYRLDELPQIINVLKGDMSFIGPRPLLPVDQPAAAGLRLSVRPGLSGWAQINGGRGISPEDKAALDAWYVKNLSLRVDMKIAIRTIAFLVKGEEPPQKQILAAARDCIQREA